MSRFAEPPSGTTQVNVRMVDRASRRTRPIKFPVEGRLLAHGRIRSSPYMSASPHALIERHTAVQAPVGEMGRQFVISGLRQRVRLSLRIRRIAGIGSGQETSLSNVAGQRGARTHASRKTGR